MRTLLKSVNCAASKTEGFDLDQTCSEAVSSITDDVCRPLRTRVEQILLLEAGPVVLYKLVQLIRNGLSLRSYHPQKFIARFEEPVLCLQYFLDTEEKGKKPKKEGRSLR